MEEKELILLSQKGDERAFSELLNNTIPKIKLMFKNSFKMLNDADLEDVIQNASIAAWNKIGKFRGVSSFLTWFYVIVKNEAISLSNKKIKEQNLIEQDGGIITREKDIKIDVILEENARMILQKKELYQFYKEAIKRAFDKLSPKHKEIFQMVFEQQMPYKEVASILNCPLGSVMSRVSYARKYAQKAIKNYAESDAYGFELDCLGRH